MSTPGEGEMSPHGGTDSASTGRLCPHCGTRNPEGSNFCNRCGTALVGASQPLRDPADPLGSADAVLDEEASQPSATAIEIDAAARNEGAVETIDEPTLEALINAYRPPVDESGVASFEPVSFPDEQLLGGGLGYLELVAVSGETAAPKAEMHPPAGAENEHWRTVRSLLRDEPVLASAGTNTTLRNSYRPLWIVILIMAAALGAILLPPLFWVGTPQDSPGVSGAYDVLRALEVDDELLVIWMADPATAAEVNAVALPVVSHLLEREAQSIVIATRPAALETARLLYGDAVRGLDESAMRSVVDNWVGPGLYLPGGMAALALVAGDPARALNFAPERPPQPRAVLVVAANPNDVQEWIEAGWSRLRLPTVAVTPASGDPMLRPYLQRGQLDGLVAGFDGAGGYQELRDTALSAAASQQQRSLTNAQNLGALALLVVLVSGNLISLLGRSRGG